MECTLARPTPLVVLLLAAALVFASCDSFISADTGIVPENDAGPPERSADTNNIVFVWNEALLEAIRTGTLGPPQIARAAGISHTVMYDAWAAYDEEAMGTQLGDDLRRPPEEHTRANKEEAISFAAYRALNDLFPHFSSELDALMDELGYDPDDTSDDVTTPVGVGNVAADAVLSFRANDGANQADGYVDTTGYEPVNPPLDPSRDGPGELEDPTRWQPLVNPDGSVQQYLAPHWGAVTPFALGSVDAFLPPEPAPLRSGEFRRQAQELIRISAQLTDREKVIAEYWEDGPGSETPPGHWLLFAQFVSQRDGHTLDDDVKLFFVVANAVFDAGVASWHCKREYDYVRPITAIRYLKQGKKVRAWAGPGRGTRVIEGGSWIPYQRESFLTPPFAEYVSGHSTYSMAAAVVLERFTGSDAFGKKVTISAGSSRIEPGQVPASQVQLQWETFTEAAEEAGMSRLYGGIHFEQGNVEGLKLGEKVGEAVWHKALEYFDGRPVQ